MASLENKLVKVERAINVYDKETEDITEEYGIEITLEALTQIITPKKDDPLMFDGYVLNEDELNKLNSYMNKKIKPDFKCYYYVLESYGVYNW
jgi:hypothetical protein